MFSMKHRLWNPVIAQTQKPQHTQDQLLKKILSANKDTVFGREHDFEKLSSYQEFSQSVDIQSYEELRPYIEKQSCRKKMIHQL